MKDICVGCIGVCFEIHLCPCRSVWGTCPAAESSTRACCCLLHLQDTLGLVGYPVSRVGYGWWLSWYPRGHLGIIYACECPLVGFEDPLRMVGCLYMYRILMSSNLGS